MHGIEPGELVLGSDNGSAFTARRFRARLGGLGIRHRRGGYRDPESQAFIETWFGKLKEREVWLNEYETLDDARHGIGGYVDRYHHRPHSGSATAHPTRSAGPGRITSDYKNSGLACQHRRGAGQTPKPSRFAGESFVARAAAKSGDRSWGLFLRRAPQLWARATTLKASPGSSQEPTHSSA